MTLISPDPYHFYSGMGPGMLAGQYAPAQISFHVKKLAEDRGARFLEARVVKINPQSRALELDSGETVGYDVASFNVGSDIPRGPVAELEENIFPVKPIKNLLIAKSQLIEAVKTKTPSILVVGGGPAGLEIAGCSAGLVSANHGKAHIALAAGSRLLGGCPERVRRLVHRSCAARGIRVVEGNRVASCRNGKAVFADGQELTYDFLFLCTGVKPPSLFLDAGMPTGEDGGLLVNEYLQSVQYPELFGGGDCINLEGRHLNKVGVYAVRENPILSHNLLAALEGKPLTRFDPGGSYLLIFNLGDGSGVFWRQNIVFAGRLAFLLKDYIDRKFMGKFQLAGELNG